MSGYFGRPTLSLCHTGENDFITIINVTSARNAMFFTMSSFSLTSKVQYQLVHPISLPSPFSCPPPDSTGSRRPSTSVPYLTLPMSSPSIRYSHIAPRPVRTTPSSNSGRQRAVKGDGIGLGSEQCIDRFAQTTLEAELTGRKLGMRRCTVADRARDIFGKYVLRFVS